MNRKNFISFLALAAASALTVHAQTNRDPIRLISGFAPGGTTDTISRLLAEHLTQELGQQVIVENKAGAGGRIAAEFLKNSRPDGKTYLVGPDGWAIFPTAMYSPATLRYDLMKDLKPVAQIVSYPLAFAVNSKIPVKNLAEYAQWLKKNPAQAQFGTPAPGGQVQFVGWVVGETLGTPLNPVSYKGNAPLLIDLIGTQLPAAILVAGDALRQSKDKVRILGVMANERWSLAPEYPTFKEQGYDVQVGEAWQGVWAHAGSPLSETERMEAAIKKVLQKPDLQQAIVKSAVVTPKFVSGKQMEKTLQQDINYWAKIIKSSGYVPQ